MVQYQLPSGAMDLSEVFGHIESSYEALRIEDYSVSQTTLDNVRTIPLILINLFIFSFVESSLKVGKVVGILPGSPSLFLYSNHTETIIMYFVTDLNYHKTQQ